MGRIVCIGVGKSHKLRAHVPRSMLQSVDHPWTGLVQIKHLGNGALGEYSTADRLGPVARRIVDQNQLADRMGLRQQ